MPPSANIPSLIGARAREFPDHPFLVSWRDIASRSSASPTSLSFLEFAVHVELAAPVALCGCLLLVHALGLPLPDVGIACAAARRAVVRRAERAPLHLCGGAGASHEQSQKLLEPPPGSPDSV